VIRVVLDTNVKDAATQVRHSIALLRAFVTLTPGVMDDDGDGILHIFVERHALRIIRPEGHRTAEDLAFEAKG